MLRSGWSWWCFSRFARDFGWCLLQGASCRSLVGRPRAVWRLSREISFLGLLSCDPDVMNVAVEGCMIENCHFRGMGNKTVFANPCWWNVKMEVLVAQSCPTLCDPMDHNPPGSTVQWILQARILEWVAIPFSRGSSHTRDQTQVSYIAREFFTAWTTRTKKMTRYTLSMDWKN